jgi:hypothetical protein
VAPLLLRQVPGGRLATEVQDRESRLRERVKLLAKDLGLRAEDFACVPRPVLQGGVGDTMRKPDPFYALGKLGVAVSALATGPRDVRSRLYSAFSACGSIRWKAWRRLLNDPPKLRDVLGNVSQGAVFWLVDR